MWICVPHFCTLLLWVPVTYSLFLYHLNINKLNKYRIKKYWFNTFKLLGLTCTSSKDPAVCRSKYAGLEHEAWQWTGYLSLHSRIFYGTPFFFAFSLHIKVKFVLKLQIFVIINYISLSLSFISSQYLSRWELKYLPIVMGYWDSDPSSQEPSRPCSFSLHYSMLRNYKRL